MKPYRHGSRVWQTDSVRRFSGAICRINKKRQVRHAAKVSYVAVDSFRPVFNTLVRGEPLNLPQENRKKRSIVRCRHIYVRLFRFVRVHALTDRRTDGRTGGQTDAHSKVRSNEVRCVQKCWNVNWNHSAYRIKVSSQSHLFPRRRRRYKLQWESGINRRRIEHLH